MHVILQFAFILLFVVSGAFGCVFLSLDLHREIKDTLRKRKWKDR